MRPNASSEGALLFRIETGDKDGRDSGRGMSDTDERAAVAFGVEALDMECTALTFGIDEVDNDRGGFLFGLVVADGAAAGVGL